MREFVERIAAFARRPLRELLEVAMNESSTRPVTHSMRDRSSVRGVRNRGSNRKRRSRREVGGVRAFMASKPILLVAALVTIAGLALVARQVHAFATTSPTFAIETVAVQGAKRATRESIVRLSRVTLGENLFALDVDAVRRGIEAHPWIASARVQRSFPTTLSIEVVEHEPIVFVNLGNLYYANTSGDLVKRYAPGERESLPIVQGLTREQIETDDGDARARLRSAIDFLLETRRVLGDGAPNITELFVDEATGVSFVEEDGDRERTVLVGHAPWSSRIARLGELERVLDARAVRADRIWLNGERRKDRVVVGRAPATEREGLLPGRASGTTKRSTTDAGVVRSTDSDPSFASLR